MSVNAAKKFEKKNYSSETWFRYVKDRRPLLIVYLLDIDSEEQQKQAEEFRKALNGIPSLGLPWACRAMMRQHCSVQQNIRQIKSTTGLNGMTLMWEMKNNG